MNELLTLSIEELRLYKAHLISLIKSKTTSVEQIKEYQRKTRQIDKRIKTLLQKGGKDEQTN